MPWGLLAAFGFVHGVGQWLDMLALSLHDTPVFLGIRVMLKAVSFVALVEFGRRGMSRGGRPAPGRWLTPLLVGLAALGALSGNMNGVNAACGCALGFPGALMAAIVFWRVSTTCAGSQRFGIRLAALSMLVYGLATGLIVPKAAFLPTNWLTHETIFAFGRAHAVASQSSPAFSAAYTIKNHLATGVAGLLITILLFLLAGFSNRQAALEREVRERTAEAKRNEDSLSATLNSISDGFYSLDDDLVFTYFNSAAETMLGRRRVDVIGKRMFDVFPHLVGSDFDVNYTSALRDKLQLTFEAYRQTTDHWYDVRVFPQRIGLSVYFQDITERKQAEAAMRSSMETLDLALKSSGMGVWQWDIAEDARVFDDRTCSLLGIDPAMFGGTAAEFIAVVHPDDRERVREHWAQTIEHDAPYAPEYRVVWPDGSIHCICARGSFVRDETGRPLRITGVLWDTTERKRAEDALQESEEKYRAISEGTAQGIVIADVETKRLMYVNPSLCRMLGYTESELLQLSVADIHPKNSLNHAMSDFEAMGQGHKRLSSALPCLRKDGTVFYADIVAAPGISLGRRKCDVAFFADVTERKLAEEALERYRLLAENSRDIMLFVGRDGHIVEANAAAVAAYGYSRSELLAMTVFDLRASDAPGHTLAQMAEADFRGILFEATHRRKDGSCFDVEVSSRGTEVGGQRLLLSVVRDITERKQAEEALQNEKNNLAAVFASSPVGLLLLDADTAIVAANSVTAGVVSRDLSQIINQRAGSGLGCVHSFENENGCGHSQACSECGLRQGIAQVLETGKSVRGAEIQVTLLIDGKQCRPWLKVSAEPTVLSGRQHVVVAIDDISDLKQAEEELRQANAEIDRSNRELVDALLHSNMLAAQAERAREQVEEHAVELSHQATHDSLTGLPNRKHFEKRLEELITGDSDQKSRSMVVLFLDLDKFKIINDTLGHKVGDLLLIEVAGRLQSCLRSEDVLARMGGDEFTVILPSCKDRSIAQTVASRIIDSISRPFNIQGHKFVIGATIGLANYPSDGDDAVTLLKHADSAMYKAKQAGRGTFCWFTGDVDVDNQQRVEMEADIRTALDTGQFNIHYQPIVSLDTGCVSAAEALLRWEHPEKGMISPSLFIPIAEEMGVVGKIGDFVMRAACAQTMEWRDQGIHLSQIGVNVSTIQVCSPGWFDSIRAVLSDTGLDPRFLNLEVTETDFSNDYESMRETLGQVQELGVCTAIDDFGMGRSSLGRLKDFPIVHLKIDGSFVRDIEHNDHDAALVRSVVDMAHNRGIKVTAEWVETETQMEILRANGCDLAQGYYFSPALSADDFRKFALQRANQAKRKRRAA